MTAFGLQTGAALIVRIVYLTISVDDYNVIFRLPHGLALMMVIDFLPELLKLTSWVTVLSYWRGLLATNTTDRRDDSGCCRGPQWRMCALVSACIWILPIGLVVWVYVERLSYDITREMEGVYLFTISCLLGGVGAFVIGRFLIYFSQVMSATQVLRKDATPLMRILRMRVTYATSLSAFAMVLYFTALLTLAYESRQMPGFVMIWRGLIVLDAAVTVIVLWLLAPRPVRSHPCCRDLRRRFNKMRIQSSRAAVTSPTGSSSGSYQVLSGGHAIQDELDEPLSP